LYLHAVVSFIDASNLWKQEDTLPRRCGRRLWGEHPMASGQGKRCRVGRGTPHREARPAAYASSDERRKWKSKQGGHVMGFVNSIICAFIKDTFQNGFIG
jgi:hypothetical protein